MEEGQKLPMTITLRKPFNGNFPITFAFGLLPSDEEVREKFRAWGIVGHNGIDFGLPEGMEVLACDRGVVVQSGPNGDFGISVTIKHRWGESICAHLKEVKIAVGKKVKKGEVIGFSGQTGTAFGPHLHFGIKPKNLNPNNEYLGYVDPSPYFVS